MKKVNVAFSFALLLAGGYCCATPATAKSSIPAQATALVITSYAQGVADGQAYAADLDAQYGKGTPEYDAALATEKARAVLLAKEADQDPLYWRGYAAGLSSY